INGGIAAIGGKWFPTRTINDAFALVRIPGQKGVHILSSNQDIGTTNAQGDFLVSNLVSYTANRVEITPRDIPIDYNIPQTDAYVLPPFRGGSVALFPVIHLQSTIGSITLVVDGMT